MTLYISLAGLGILIFTGVALAEAALSGSSSAQVAFGFQFAFFASLSILLAAVTLYANRLLREHSSSIGRASAWRRRIVVAALVFVAGSVTILIAATREPGDALTCAGQCEAGGGAIAGEASIILLNGSEAAVVGSESARALATGRTLFQERGCVGCHQPNATGVGPTLYGLFGSPVQYPGSGTAIVDETYLREAILNPSATVATGFTPVMPTFAGQLTEEELQGLIVYLKRLPGDDSISLLPRLKVRSMEKLGWPDASTMSGDDRKVSIRTTLATSLTRAQDTAGSGGLSRWDQRDFGDERDEDSDEC
jgi:mono/diheme cytochrome c family protein